MGREHEGGAVTRWPADERFTSLVVAHGRDLVRLAYLVTGSTADAQDAVHEAVISVSAAWHRVDATTALPYLRKAVTRKAIDQVRRRRETPRWDPPETVVADRGLLRLEEDQEFLGRLQILAPGQRAVLVLRYWADLPDQEIADAVGCSVQTVRSQAHRGLAHLREAATKQEGP